MPQCGWLEYLSLNDSQSIGFGEAKIRVREWVSEGATRINKPNALSTLLNSNLNSFPKH